MLEEKNQRPRPAVLCVLDGFGTAPDDAGNAITRANTPNFDHFTERYPVVNVKASGEAVGLMWGEMGNSEVGHLTIGAGRVFYQTLPRIEQSIKDESFFENQALKTAIAQVKKTGGTLHLMGIMSSGKVHGYNMHCYAILELLKREKIKDVAVHAILDGRDTIYNSGKEFIAELLGKMKEIGVGELATLSGRYYTMDRDNRWDRIEAAYNAIVLGTSPSTATDPMKAIDASYKQKIYDEEFVPTVMMKRDKPVATIKKNDAVIFFNFRPDRARQITKAITLPTFEKFERDYIENVAFVTLGEFEKGLPVQVAFPPETLKNTLSEVISDAGLVQLHIAETEKYAHVTFFFNGTREDPFPHEDRKIIPSPKVESYDQKPGMSAKEMTDQMIKEIQTGNYDVIVTNYANPDMVSHTGNMEASVKAIEAVDVQIGRLAKAVLKAGGVLMITADHGNAEEVENLQTRERDKEHSTNPVPLWVIGEQFEGKAGLSGDVPNGDLSLLPPVGMLADVAPTFLALMGIEPPPEMTGESLLPE